MTATPPKKGPAAKTPVWMQRKERGSALLLRFMTWLSLSLGRRLTRPIVYGIAAYFLLAVPAARKASRAYQRRVLGRPARWGDLYRHILAFASTIHDRVYLLNGCNALFDIRIHGEELLPPPDAQGSGCIILGSHLGSFEVLRAVARKNTQRQVCAAMYPENARLLNSMLARVNAQVVHDIVALGQFDAMLTLKERLEAGAIVALLADRAVRQEGRRRQPFLGDPAAFPLGPFRLAALLGRPMFFMAGLYRGGNRYDVHFERLADFSDVSLTQRDEAIQQAMERYATLLEQHCRLAPDNWFNFYDFWEGDTRAAP